MRPDRRHLASAIVTLAWTHTASAQECTLDLGTCGNALVVPADTAGATTWNDDRSLGDALRPRLEARRPEWQATFGAARVSVFRVMGVGAEGFCCEEHPSSTLADALAAYARETAVAETRHGTHPVRTTTASLDAFDRCVERHVRGCAALASRAWTVSVPRTRIPVESPFDWSVRAAPTTPLPPPPQRIEDAAGTIAFGATCQRRPDTRGARPDVRAVVSSQCSRRSPRAVVLTYFTSTMNLSVTLPALCGGPGEPACP